MVLKNEVFDLFFYSGGKWLFSANLVWKFVSKLKILKQKKYSFECNFITSKRKPSLTEIHDGKLVFEKNDDNWVNVLPTITKQDNIREHSAGKSSPNQGSPKYNGSCVQKNLEHRRARRTQKFIIGDLVKTKVSKKMYSNLIKLIDLMNFIEMQKGFLIHFQVMEYIIYLRDMMKSHWKRHS